MELIQRHRKLINHPKYNNYIFYNDYGVLVRSNYKEHKRVYVERNVKNMRDSGSSLIVLKYENELVFEEIHIDSLAIRELIKASEFKEFFKDENNLNANSILHFEYNEGKLFCTFKENDRRFTVFANLITSEKKVVAEWQI